MTKKFIASFEFEAEDIFFATQAAFNIVYQYRLNALRLAIKAHAKNLPDIAADFEKAADGIDVVIKTINVEEKE